MSIVKKFLHTRMRVNDLEQTVAFYQKVFGLQVTKRHESPRGSKLVFLAVPNSDEEIEIVKERTPPPELHAVSAGSLTPPR